MDVIATTGNNYEYILYDFNPKDGTHSGYTLINDVLMDVHLQKGPKGTLGCDWKIMGWDITELVCYDDR